MASEAAGEVALRTAGNSEAVVSTILIALPIFIVVVSVLCVFYVLKAIRYAHKRPLSAAIAPLMVLAVRHAVMMKLPVLLEPVINSSYAPDPKYSVGKVIPVADLHCDAMLWTSGARPLSRTIQHPFFGRPVGSIDIPRLTRGSVRIQVFAAVTSSPRGMNFESNERPPLHNDILTIMSLMEWPMNTYSNTLQRALFQAKQLHRNAKNSDGRLVVIRNSQDLQNVLDDEREPIAAILAVEGLHVLNHRVENVDVLYDAGYRILGPTHFFDTEVGGSSSGVTKLGLSELGNEVIARMTQRERAMIVDVAHSSEQLIGDLINLPNSQRPPLILSHTGVREVCPSKRNYPIDLIGKLIERNALIGITLFEPSLCGDDLILSFVQTVVYIVKSFGSNNVCLGSDWDGAVHTAVDAGDVQVLAEALRKKGNLSDTDVEKIMFKNAKNFFLKYL